METLTDTTRDKLNLSSQLSLQASSICVLLIVEDLSGEPVSLTFKVSSAEISTLWGPPRCSRSDIFPTLSLSYLSFVTPSLGFISWPCQFNSMVSGNCSYCQYMAFQICFRDCICIVDCQYLSIRNVAPSLLFIHLIHFTAIFIHCINLVIMLVAFYVFVNNIHFIKLCVSLVVTYSKKLCYI